MDYQGQKMRDEYNYKSAHSFVKFFLVNFLLANLQPNNITFSSR